MIRRFVPILTAVMLSTSGIAAGLYATAPQEAATAPGVQAATPVPALPPHPHLLLNRRGIIELKGRIASDAYRPLFG